MVEGTSVAQLAQNCMRRALICFALLFAVSMAFGQARSYRVPAVNAGPWSERPVVLSFRPLHDGKAFVGAQLRYSFDAPLLPELTLRLPDEWGGETRLYAHWRDLKVQGAQLLPGDAPQLRKLKLEPGARVEISYRVVSPTEARAAPGTPGYRNDYRPQFAGTYFHLLGNAIVPQIDGMWGSTLARFELEGMPPGASFASDLEHQAMGRTLTVSDLSESVLVGGDFRILDAGQGARIAIHGQWSRPDAVWQTQFSRIAAAQRAYWRTGPEPYLVTILDLPMAAPGSSSVGGTGRSDAFAFFATPNADPARLDQVMSHEMMHTWIPRRIGGLTLQHEARGYWLSEGFTDWASWRSNVAGGLWSPQDFAKALNEALLEHDTSASRQATMAEIAEGFWRSRDMANLPYRRGMIFGLWLDERLRAASQGKTGLDDVLRHMTTIVPADAADQGGARTVLLRSVRELVGLDISSELARHIDAGEPLQLPANTLAECGRLQEAVRATFHRGFDVQATTEAGNVIQGVVRGSPAERAGLKNGMKILRRIAGNIGDSRAEIAYELQDGTEIKTLRWMPQGEGTERLRSLSLPTAPDAAQQRACLQRLGAV